MLAALWLALPFSAYAQGADCSSVMTSMQVQIRTGNECSDGIDNDLDGLTDLADPGCTGASDPSEDAASTLALECSNGIDDDGDGGVDWFGADTGGTPDVTGQHGDTGCPTPDYALGECRTPTCAPASNAAGVGLASISPAVPAWPGAYKALGSGGCPATNVLSTAGAVYSYCDFPNALNVTAANVTCYGCRVRLSTDSVPAAIEVKVANSNFRFVYGLVEPGGGGNPPWNRTAGYQYGFFSASSAGALGATAAAPWTFERSTFRGYGNAINIDGSGCNLTHPCTVRAVTLDYPRDDQATGGGASGVDHTDGVACTGGGSCPGNYVTMTGITFFGAIVHPGGGSVTSANTNSIGMQGPSGNYDHHLITRNYFSSWNYIDFARANGSNFLVANNWWGTEFVPPNDIMAFDYPSTGSTWANNRVNDTTDGTWAYPRPADENRFWAPGDQISTAKLTTDVGGNTQFPYPEPACNDSIDNDGDGNIDYPWDPTCASPWGASE